MWAQYFGTSDLGSLGADSSFLMPKAWNASAFTLSEAAAFADHGQMTFFTPLISSRSSVFHRSLLRLPSQNTL